MGYLYYGNNSYAVEIDDRPLAHLKIAILSALRAGRGVAFCFNRPLDIGSGRETLWISPSTEIRFRFHGNRVPQINEHWVKSIILTADSDTGLRLVPEESAVPVLLRSAG
ncbi:hypothetical protein BH10ACT7_BH10ACT7_30400 [soil metagenome]